MSATETRQVGNWLLDALPTEVYERLVNDLQPVSFDLGEVVYEPGGQMDYVYFPTTCHVSLLYTMINGVTAEMGLVGNEGVVGIALFMGGDTTPNRAMVQGAGQAVKLKAKSLHAEFGRGGGVQTLLPPNTTALCPQTSKTS